MEDPWAAGPSWSTPSKPTSDPTHADALSASTSTATSSATDTSAHTSAGEIDDPWGSNKTPTVAPTATPTAAGDVGAGMAALSLDADKGFGGWGEDVNAGWGAPVPSAVPAPSAVVETPQAEPVVPLESAHPDGDGHVQGDDETVISVPIPKATTHDSRDDEGPTWGLDSPQHEPAASTSTADALPSDTLPSAVALPGSPPPIVHTPPPADAPLPSITSLASGPSFSPSLSHGSPGLGFPPSVAARVLDEGFGGGGLGMGMPKSPSFGSDFGGFATVAEGDPWGGDAWGGGAAGRRDSGFSFSERKEREEEGEEGGGWGGARGVASPTVNQGDDEWESAQRRMKVQQERVPHERIESIRQGWKEVAGAVIGLDKVVELTDEEERVLENAVREIQADTADTLTALSTLPQDTNIYPPVLTSLSTYQRYQTALSRPNPNPSTSLLTIPFNANMRRRTDDSLVFDVPDYSWAGRSRLGEPDAPAQDAAVAEESGGSRWAFWNRKAGAAGGTATPKALTTSGGGVLEVKSATTPTSTMSSPMSAAIEAGASASSINSQQGSAGISGLFGRSRPATPEPTFAAAPTQSSPASLASQNQAAAAAAAASQGTYEDSGHMAPGGSLDPNNQPASAVSRFFGRFGGAKRSLSQRNLTTFDATDYDVELTTDDLSYLAEVPSMPAPNAAQGVGDLLQLDPSHRPAASLEAVLGNNSGQAVGVGGFQGPPPSNQPLTYGQTAPAYPSIGRPPPGGRTSVPGSRQASSSFVPRMKTDQRSVTATSFDLLSGLDFDESEGQATNTASAPQPATSGPVVTSPVSTTGPNAPSSAWDDFLATKPTSFVTPVMQTQPTLASPIGPPLPSVSKARAPPISTSSLNDDFGDFGDFSTPASQPTRTAPQQPVPTANSGFDDFGDFSVFETPKPGPAPSTTTLAPPHHKPMLDHTPTINLLSDASALKGRRWPAPPSPVAPQLEPPPRAPSGSTAGVGAFPFLSPPPPGRPASGAGLRLDLMGEGQGGDPAAPSTAQNGIASPPTQAAGLGLGMGPQLASLTPARSASGSAANPTKPASAPMGQGGLSAQELSFFDSL